MHFEHPARRLDELHVSLGIIMLDLGRQTGGSWFVPSDTTILNRNLHGLLPWAEIR
jgi:hypothetical protein